jgi:pyruvate/2-oxoglutarate dehydrogenase complex dihydrolipoamide acyltransferase (E2) component
MAVEIAIPKLGFTMVDATLTEWQAREGDCIEKGIVVLVIEGEKSSWDIEAEDSGFLHIMVQQGEKALVGEVVGIVCETEEELEKVQREIPPGARGEPLVAEDTSKKETTAPTQAETIEKEVGHIRISPLARKVAQEKSIDITSVVGTGPAGRITLADVEKAIGLKKESWIATEEIYEGKRVARSVSLEGMRKAIADLMYQSRLRAPQATLLADFDMTEIMRVRTILLNQPEREDYKVSYTDLFVFVLARVLKDNPIFNASLIDDEIKFWEDINIGIAISLGDQGILLPVVKNADQKSIMQIAQLSKELVRKARENKLRPDDVIGGTFTFSNVGMLSISRYQTPIIVPPHSAILAAAAIKDTPVVIEGQVVVRSMATFCLTYDHRIIDGENGERFLMRFNELLQSPRLLEL